MDARKLRSLIAVLATVTVVVLVAWYRERGSEAADDGLAAERGLPRLVDVGAGTCKACVDMIPILEAVKAEFDGRAVVDVFDIREDKDAIETYDVRLIPTQVFFDREGREVWRHEGFLPKAEIVSRLEGLEH